jgi:hypothetical protein
MKAGEVEVAVLTFGNVDDMRIVTNGASIGCWIVVAEHAEFLQLSDRHLRQVRHDVLRNSFRTFTNSSRRMCSDGVEVTQRKNSPPLKGKYFKCLQTQVLSNPLPHPKCKRLS